MALSRQLLRRHRFPGPRDRLAARGTVWAENYYGYILRPDLIDATQAGATIKAALSAMYQEGRFLGGFDWAGAHGRYQDHSLGDVSHFHGREVILVSGVEAYALDYCGGLIKS